MNNPFSVCLPRPSAVLSEDDHHVALPRNLSHSYANPTKRKRKVEPGQTRQQRVKQAEEIPHERIGYEKILEVNAMDFSMEDASPPTVDVIGIAEEGGWDHEPVERVDPYAFFSESVKLGTCKILQISLDIFVVQGWNTEQGIPLQSWYHLQRTQSGNEILLGCCCPSAITHMECIHIKFVRDFGGSMFPDDGALGSLSDIVCFSVDPMGEEEIDHRYYFSVGLGSASLKSRTIVTYQSSLESNCEGSFKCQSDQRSQNCAHISAVRNHPYIQETCSRGGTEGPEVGRERGEIVAREPAFRGNFQAVSHRSIPFPRWAALEGDELEAIQPPPPLPFPPLLLDSNSTCSCRGSSSRTTFNPALPTVRQNCLIYGLITAYTAEIELQRCPGSADPGIPHHFIGPDLKERGIFNLNNTSLFTHELLNGYTSAFTCSETPFTSWTSQVSRFYNSHASPHPLISDEGFRTAWFAFVNLQVKDGDMACSLCGPNPKTTIWDGVTLSFSRKHLQPTIKPPTSLDGNSPTHNRKYISHQQFILKPLLRRSLSSVVSSAYLGDIHKLLMKVQDFKPKEKQRSAINSLIKKIRELENELDELDELNPTFCQLFKRIFGLSALALGPPSSAYVALFKQIVADESTLQMINRPALEALKNFLSTPQKLGSSKVLEVPAICAVLEEAGRQSIQRSVDALPKDLVGTLEWMSEVAESNLSRILSNGSPADMDPVSLPETDWRQSGCYYSMPQIRHRPVYPSLTHDKKQESSGSRGAKCSKYYSLYGKQRLTGGIMAAWCTHSICYGFHFIPAGEGRNDVFSALYTRWLTPPERVIYDFACALGPYCLTREGEFFANTSFNVDTFHAKGHTKCSSAAFLKTYTNTDPRLIHVNSSAAECGNSGIRRIRKSVSYMTQERAIVYTRVFLSIWNRQRIRKLMDRSV